MRPPVGGLNRLSCQHQCLGGAHRDLLASDLGGDHQAEPVPPEPHRLVADVDAALVQLLIDVVERKRKPRSQRLLEDL